MHLCPRFETEQDVSEGILSDICLLEDFFPVMKWKNYSVLSFNLS